MKQSNESLQTCVERYVGAVAQGDIVRAYRGILAALTQFKSSWESTHPQDAVGALYQGYLDMSFVAVLPLSLAEKRLKISLVFLHETGTFTLWLTAGNRAIQKNVSTALQRITLGRYQLTELEPGVDAIIALDLPKPYAFDEPDALTMRLVAAAEAFLADMTVLIQQIDR
jgi:hypothetical protein